jgi:hypothetical protein
MTISETIGSLGSAITSPAKLAFAGYVLLAYGRHITTSKCEFFIVATIFFLLQVGHDDYLRIWLNKRAERM